MTVQFRIVRTYSVLWLSFFTLLFLASGKTASAQQPANISLRMVRYQGDPLTSGKANFLTASLADSAKQLATNAFFILQFKGPIQKAWRDRLATAGVKFHDYIPEYAYLVKLNADALTAAQSDPSVRWIGAYASSYKMDFGLPALAHDLAVRTETTVRKASPDAETAPVNPAEVIPEFAVLLFKGEDVQAIGRAVETLGGKVLGTQTYWYKDELDIRIDSSKLPALAALPSVKWIEQSLPALPCSNIVASNTVCDVKTVWDTYGLRGEGQVVGIADTGMDQGYTNSANLNIDFQDGAGNSRILTILDWANDSHAEDYGEGHGTMVAGVLLGNGKHSGTDPTNNSFPSGCFAGMAPKAQCVFEACGRQSDGVLCITNASDLFDAARDANTNLFIHSDSWGWLTPSRYTIKSSDVDAYVWSNKNFLALFGAGNEAIDSDSSGRIDAGYEGTFPGQIISPATAKNCISVGATENYRTNGWGGATNCTWGEYADGNNGRCFPVAPIATDHVSNCAEGMMARSSRGPCDDGRIKPDIVAPGVNVLSVRGNNCTGCYGLYTGPGPGTTNDYSWFGGTSCATPLIAGMATLVRQYLTEGRYPGVANPPSAALMKAILLNGATNIAPGQYGTSNGTQEIPNVRPNNVEGWGRANLNSALFSLQGAGLKIFGTDITTNDVLGTGDAREYQVAVKAGTPLTATLVWTDEPGSPTAAKALVNDLNLTIVDTNGTTYYANNPQTTAARERLSHYGDATIDWCATSSAKNVEIAVKFGPDAASPYQLSGTRLYFKCFKTNETITLKLRDVAAGGSPGNVITNVTVLPHQSRIGIGYAEWFPFSAINLAQGSNYFVCAKFPDTYNWQVGYVATNKASSASWYCFTGAWGQLSNMEYALDAFFLHDCGAVTNDNINNVEGIDIATPQTGVYTVRVSCANLGGSGDPAFGNKQPFAVVVRGDVPDLRRQGMWAF